VGAGCAHQRRPQRRQQHRRRWAVASAACWRLVDRAWVAERIQRAAGELNGFRIKSEAEHPTRFAAAAGDVAMCRSVVRDNKKRSKDLDHLRNKRSEALAKHSPGKLVTIGNSVSRGVVGKKGDSDYVEDGLLFETAADHEVLEKTFSRLNGNTISTVNLKLINDLNTGFKNTIKKYGKDSPEVINAINAIVSKSNNADAMLALLNNTEVLRGQLELVKNPSGGTNRSKLAQFKKT
jgi:hypothetical protein